MAQLDHNTAGMVAGLADHLGMREPTPDELAAFEAKLSTGPRHCDDYIDDETQPECLRRFLDYNRLSPSLKYPTSDEAFNQKVEERIGRPMWRDPVPTLFAIHEGRQVRVTMASRFGDVGITYDLTAEHGYGERVAVEELSGFSATAPEPILYVDCAHAPWGGGYVGNPANRAAAARHYEGIAQLAAPPIFEGNRAQRRAAASLARKGL